MRRSGSLQAGNVLRFRLNSLGDWKLLLYVSCEGFSGLQVITRCNHHVAQDGLVVHNCLTCIDRRSWRKHSVQPW